MNKQTVKILFVRQLSDIQKSQAKALTTTAPDFNISSPTPERIAEHIDKYCSEMDIVGWVLAYENNEIVGRIGVFKRSVELLNKQISLGGIGKVRVRLDKRKKGIGSQMMDIAMKQLWKEKCDIALLGTKLDTFLKDFYEKYGFIALPQKYTFKGKSGKIYEETDGMLAPILSIDLFNNIIQNNIIFHMGTGNW